MAANFCSGNFGQSGSKEFLAVQSLDGSLDIYEQEAFSFSRFLPNFLLPGPLVYVASSDIFVTASAARVVEAYKYQVLAVASDQGKDGAGKKVKHEWVFNSGEVTIDIKVWPAKESLLVLNMRSLTCLTYAGQVTFMLRLEVPPAAILPLNNNFVLASSVGQLLIYNNNELLWAAQHGSTPCQLAVLSVESLEGLIVSLSDCGKCNALFLGTDPSLPTLAPPSSQYRDLDLARLDHELKNLQGRIKQATNTHGNQMPAVKEAADLQLSHHIVSEANTQEVTVAVSGKTKSNIQEVQLAVECPLPIEPTQNRLTFSFVDASHPIEAFISFKVNASLMCPPSRLNVKLIATFTSASGAPKCVQSTVYLPFTLCVQPAVPEKQAAVKLTFESNKPPCNLESLFPELRMPDVESNGAAVAFQYLPSSAPVTIVASQAAQKYRLQSDSLDALALPSMELHRRLRAQYGDSAKLTLSGPIPFADYCQCVDRHWSARTHLSQIEAQVEQKATQYRAIQKRLLTRFKDKTAQPLQNLDALLESAVRQLLTLAEAAEEAKLEVKVSASCLGAANSLLCFIIQNTGLPDADAQALQRVLSSSLDDFPDAGIEEQLDASLTHLLRTALSRGGSKDVQVSAAALQPPKDAEKVKKHVQMLCEKLARGASLTAVVETPVAPSFSKPSVTSSVVLPDSEAVSDTFTPNTFLDQMKSPREHKSKKKKKHHKKKRSEEKGLPQLDSAAFLMAPAAETSFYD